MPGYCTEAGCSSAEVWPCAPKMYTKVCSSRLDPCSVDFGRETPKFWFEFCRGFWGGFFLQLFSKEKIGGKKPPKIPPQNSPRNLFRKIPLGFLQKPFLECSVNYSHVLFSHALLLPNSPVFSSRPLELPTAPKPGIP